MKVIELLKKVAVNAKVIQIVKEAEAVVPEKIETTSISLAQLIAQNNKALGGNTEAPELRLDFAKIYEMYKVAAPAHGWDVGKISGILAGEEFKKLDPNAVKKVIAEMLTKNKIPPQDIIKDAVSRDSALDAYEQLVDVRLKERKKVNEEKIVRLKAAIEESKKTISQLEAAQAQDQKAFEHWLDKKVSEEEALVEIVVLFTSAAVISVGPVSEPDYKPKKT